MENIFIKNHKKIEFQSNPIYDTFQEGNSSSSTMSTSSTSTPPFIASLSLDSFT